MSSQRRLLLRQGGRQTGGLMPMPFILANAAMERLSTHALTPNMIKYLMGGYGMELAQGTQVIFIWNYAINFTPLLGASLTDSYLGRFLTIGLASIICFLGMVLLWLTTLIPQTKPPPCIEPHNCESATPAQLALLFASLAMISVGSGSLRPCSLAFGADQLDQRSGGSSKKYALESYFNWYYTLAAVSVLISLTGMVYVQDHFGWRVGFGVSVVLMFFAAFLFFAASSLYTKHSASGSVLVEFAQVVVASFRKRGLLLPPTGSAECYHCQKDSKFLVPTDTLRFLNKACIVTTLDQEIAPDGFAGKTCTVEQVEQLKALLRVTPIWSTGIMVVLNISQNTFLLQQASSMDRHITSTVQIPAGSFSMFMVITIIFWNVLYDRVILPLASRLCGKPVRLGVKLRMGIGIFMSCVAMVVSVIVEQIRRQKAAGLSGVNAVQAGTMSAMWLIPQCAIHGLAEAFSVIAQTEFYYSDALGASAANLLASAILSLVDYMTSRNGNVSWASRDINSGRYDSYYTLLAALSFANLVYFMACSWAYGPCKGDASSQEEMLHKEEEEEEVSLLGSRRMLGEV
uniref:Uncharacterized protein n=1 Tax=Kalanchoe fedtschenkoi TaxID=63787 RepID=A0A7N0VHM3_KALFE